MKITKEYNKTKNFGFDFMIPKDKEWFSPKDVAQILGSSDQYVRNCIYSGRIFAHVSTKDSVANQDNKSYIRIHRQAIEMYLLATANYTNDLFIEKLFEILSTRNDFELMRIEKLIKDMLYKTTNSRKFSPHRY